MNAEISLNSNGDYCAELQTDTLTGYTFFPIIRQSHWETRKQVTFTDGQAGVIYFVATLYLSTV